MSFYKEHIKERMWRIAGTYLYIAGGNNMKHELQIRSFPDPEALQQTMLGGVSMQLRPVLEERKLNSNGWIRTIGSRTMIKRAG